MEREADKVILWGWGMVYDRYADRLALMEKDGQIRIAGITGNSLPPFRTLDGYELIPPSEIGETGAEYVLILNIKEEEEITRQLLASGIGRERILPWRILEIPRFDFRKYIRLKERRLSIISDDCWGGFVSRMLCMEHRSPFKNMFLPDGDYLKCLGDLKHYCTEAEPVFLRWQDGNEPDDVPRYPVLLLDDIELYCNHDEDPDAAAAKWMRRREKLTFDRLFVEMRTERREIEEKFQALSQYPDKICFVPYETALPDSLQIARIREEDSFMRAVHKNVIPGNRYSQYSILDLLLGEGDHLRMKEPVRR